ncbi:MAG TPA: hypothetical protein VMT90_06135 [Dehalococcoidia bacterium]|nr:hypothetical protein [Dehalococcoidia bacterium]
MTRIRGSHHILADSTGRRVSVPVHAARTIPPVPSATSLRKLASPTTS